MRSLVSRRRCCQTTGPDSRLARCLPSHIAADWFGHVDGGDRAANRPGGHVLSVRASISNTISTGIVGGYGTSCDRTWRAGWFQVRIGSWLVRRMGGPSRGDDSLSVGDPAPRDELPQVRCRTSVGIRLALVEPRISAAAFFGQGSCPAPCAWDPWFESLPIGQLEPARPSTEGIGVPQRRPRRPPQAGCYRYQPLQAAGHQPVDEREPK
jgi:hypothetical protein